MLARTTTAPMLEEPNPASEQVSEALLGELVEIVEQRQEFSLVRTPDGYPGWLLTESLVPLSLNGIYPEAGAAIRVTSAVLPLHEAPNEASPIVGAATVGNLLARVGAAAEWTEVELPDGDHAFAPESSLAWPNAPSTEELPTRIVELSTLFLGTPYLWGGRTPLGVDCSGFTQRLYSICGIQIPRDAYQQVAWEGFAVADAATAPPGSLLFFRGDRDPHGRGITHVGMAIGSGRMIHACQASGVTVCPIRSRPYDRQLVGCRTLGA